MFVRRSTLHFAWAFRKLGMRILGTRATWDANAQESNAKPPWNPRDVPSRVVYDSDVRKIGNRVRPASPPSSVRWPRKDLSPGRLFGLRPDWMREVETGYRPPRRWNFHALSITLPLSLWSSTFLVLIPFVHGGGRKPDPYISDTVLKSMSARTATV